MTEKWEVSMFDEILDMIFDQNDFIQRYARIKVKLKKWKKKWIKKMKSSCFRSFRRRFDDGYSFIDWNWVRFDSESNSNSDWSFRSVKWVVIGRLEKKGDKIPFKMKLNDSDQHDDEEVGEEKKVDWLILFLLGSNQTPRITCLKDKQGRCFCYSCWQGVKWSPKLTINCMNLNAFSIISSRSYLIWKIEGKSKKT